MATFTILAWKWKCAYVARLAFLMRNPRNSVFFKVEKWLGMILVYMSWYWQRTTLFGMF